MARDHGRVKVSIWEDPDFRSLPASAQHLYLALVTQPQLTYAGSLPLYLKRFAKLSSDLTPAKVSRSLAVLVQAKFVLLDDETGELLVRSYVRHDGIIGQPNVAKAMAKAVTAIASPTLREAVTCELIRLHRDQPDARGWKAISEGWPDLYARAVNPSWNPLPNPSAKGSDNPSGKGSATPFPPSPFPLPSSGQVSQSPHQSNARPNSGPDLDKIAAELRQPRSWAARVASDVLARAGPTTNPTAYILAAIRGEPHRYQPTTGPPPIGRLCDHGRDRLSCIDCAKDQP